MSLSRIIVPMVLGGAFVLGGCTIHTEPEPVYATTEVTSAPVQIDTYPHTEYQGRTVYLYNDHWYYRNGNRWSYYNSEPAPLNRQRRYVQQAPPAQRGYAPPPQAAPQAQPYRNNGPSEAPPAVRVQ